MEWNEYFLSIAEAVKMKSKDETKIGAVITTPDGRIISTGYNGFPRGLNDVRKDRHERPEKYYFTSHAEENAIVSAAFSGVSTKGGAMFVTSGIPCCSCTRMIINAGIKVLWCKKVCTTTGEHWAEERKRSIEMLLEVNVNVNYYGQFIPTDGGIPY